MTLSLAKLSIKALALTTRIGALPFEQQIEQTLWLDVELSLDIRQIAATDDLNQAVDYAQLAQMLQETAKTHHYQLIETLVSHLQQQIIKTYPQILAGKLSLQKKGALKQAQGVAIEVSWG